MGVPVVGLAGPTPASRGGLSILSAAGLAELAAGDVQQYAQLPWILAGDLPRLRELRATFARSPAEFPFDERPATGPPRRGRLPHDLAALVRRPGRFLVTRAI